jgi:hypothetical protein
MDTAMFAAARSGDAGDKRRLEDATDEEEPDARATDARGGRTWTRGCHTDAGRELGAVLDSQDTAGKGRVWPQPPLEDNGAVAEALNALGLEHPGEVIIEPSSYRLYTPDGTPVYTVLPELRASHGLTSSRTVESCSCARRGIVNTHLLDLDTSVRLRALPRTHLRVCTPAMPMTLAVAWAPAVAPSPDAPDPRCSEDGGIRRTHL